jgi:tRNA1(Val) A37 N6-methylase TrmN6
LPGRTVLEPKEMRLVCPDKEKNANYRHAVLTAQKGGGKELKILKALLFI